MLRLEGITCAYGPVAAVRDLDLEARERAIVCVLGANGAGKSTTLKAIAGLVAPLSGRIWLAGNRPKAFDGLTRFLEVTGMRICGSEKPICRWPPGRFPQRCVERCYRLCMPTF